jgi:hypothetical protein
MAVIKQEQGATFSPRTNARSMQLVENDHRSLIERNNSYVQKRNEKIAQEQSTGVKECTFRPRVHTAQRPEGTQGTNIVERLYSYLEYYEQRRQDFKRQLQSQSQSDSQFQLPPHP